MLRKLFLVSLVALAFACSTDAPAPPDFNEQLKKDVALIDEYLTTNAINAIRDTSGVRYKVDFAGTGLKPGAASVVYVNVKGTVMSNGNVVVDLKDRYVKLTLGDPNTTLPCFQVVLPQVNRGSAVTIYSPSGYAYGSTSTTDGALPPNSNMIFNLKMLDEVAQFTSDTTAIENYLSSKGITATTDPSGLRYAITLLGTGTKPTASSSIGFTYIGKIMSTDKVFDQSIGTVTAQMSQLIRGFQIGMQQLPAGSKATFFIPSSLGYGPTGDNSGTIPSNANLIFEVELISTNN